MAGDDDDDDDGEEFESLKAPAPAKLFFLEKVGQFWLNQSLEPVTK